MSLLINNKVMDGIKLTEDNFCRALTGGAMIIGHDESPLEGCRETYKKYG